MDADRSGHFTLRATCSDLRLVMYTGSLERLAARNLDVARWLWALTARNLDHAQEHMMLLGRKTATERVAAFLLEMDECMQPAGAITLPMSRRDIADYLGLTLETVSRTMSQLQSEGAVELGGARQVTLHSRAKLRTLGSEESWQ
jgi:CRP/FNR family nitrogen fixation transcriptional regulator